MRPPRRGLAAALTLAVSITPLSLVLAAPTAAAAPTASATSSLVVNEVESNGDPVGDWVELANPTDSDLDASGLVVKDNDDTHALTLPAGSSVPAHGYAAFYTDQSVDGFGLGGGDSARLFEADGTTLIDSYTWTAHAATTYGRCPDGTGDFVTTLSSTRAAPNDCPAAFAPADIRLNEVESNGDVVGDWVEITNTGDVSADISGYQVLDSDPTHAPATVPATTVLASGEFYAMYTEFPPPGFGLGSADSVTLYQSDGTSVVDTYAWDAHAATTYGRCPDGTGEWQVTTVATRGTANACSPIRLNEIESSAPDGGPDYVELVNLSDTAVSVQDWVVKDNSDTNPTTLGALSVPAGGYLLLDDLAAGLGSSDSARLFDPSAKLIDSYTWTSHAATTYGRCADGIGAFVETRSATPGSANDCPGLDTEPWPGSQEVATSDDADTFGQDASGLAFDPADPSVLWVAQNKAGTLNKMTKDGATWVRAAGWATGRDPKYADGTGSPDTEGITIGPDGAVYLASERNNEISGISRNTVLRYDPETSMSATDEWDINPLLPALGANLGLEGITYVPDTYLTGNGLVDSSTGQAYDPADYPDHGDGLYAVVVEGTGLMYLLALDQTDAVQEAVHLVATADPQLVTNAGSPSAMDVTFDPERQQVWVLCDDSCDGTFVTMEIDDAGSFEVVDAYDRPLGMPNLNNEGMAIAPRSTCVDGAKEVVWSDDGDTDSHALRSGTITCTDPVVVTPPPPAPSLSSTAAPSIAGTARVGETLTGDGGSWSPEPSQVALQWLLDGEPVSGATGTSFELTAEDVGRVVTLRAVASLAGYPDAGAVSAPTQPVARGVLTSVSQPGISGTAQVGSRVTGTAGEVSPAPTSTSYQWLADGAPIAGATGPGLDVTEALLGKALALRVTFGREGYESVALTSASTSPVQPAPVVEDVFTVEKRPEISGRPRPRQTLVVDVSGAVTPTPQQVQVTWLVGGKEIRGRKVTTADVEGDTLRLTRRMRGKRVVAVVTFAAPGYESTTLRSEAVRVRR